MTNNTQSPFQKNPPSSRKLMITTVAALGLAAVVVVAFILPSEYGIDPTGIGKATGLTELNAPVEAGKTIQLTDVIGGNETLKEVVIPDFGDPVPLPNPAVYQDQAAAPASRSFTLQLDAYDETEVKVVLQEGKMVMYDWAIDKGTVYVDFHGHDPALGKNFWVRYKEQQEGKGAAGSLVAPFKGEHGWFFQNYNEFPVTITLNVQGYFDDTIDYGVWNPTKVE